MTDPALARLLDPVPRAGGSDRWVGSYRLLRPIGEGGMGVVHLGRGRDGARVAVKVLRPHVVGDAEGRHRLEREIAAMHRVRHARVAPCLDGDPWGAVPYVVTRFVPGATLAEHVRDVGPLEGPGLRALATGLAQAVAAVHEVGVLHRDVKPSNVMIERGEPVLIDFGMAMAGDESRLTQPGWLLGTPAYLAPETVLGAEPRAAADVYGWAATVVFACTGHGPVGGGPTVAVLDRVRRGEHDLGGVPGDLLPLVGECLVGDPRARPTAAEVVRRLHGEPAGTTRVVPAPEDGATRMVSTATTLSTGGAMAWAPAAEPTPRWARAARWLTGAAWALLLTSGLASVPVVTTALVLVAMLLVQAQERTRAVRWRRQDRRGVRRTDGARAVVGWPWHLLVSVPSALLTSLSGLLVGVLLLAAALALDGRPQNVLPGVAAVVVLTWRRGPRARCYYGAVRRLVARTSPPPHRRWALLWVLLAGGAAVLLLLPSYGPVWFPLSDDWWPALG